MKEYLACPYCNNSFQINNISLYCYKCNIKWFDRGGYFSFINHNNLDEHSEFQIKYFENEEATSSNTYMLEPWQSSYVKRFLENITIPSGAVVFESGTGSGYMAIELAKRGYKVIASDLTEKSIIRLNNIVRSLNLNDKVLCIVANAVNLPIKSESTSIFISNAVLEHIEDEAKAINEVNRILIKGGEIMLTVPISYKYLNPLLLPVNYIHDKLIGHLRRYSKEDLNVKFTRNKIYKVLYTGHTLKVIKIILNKLTHLFDEQEIEYSDLKKENNKLFSSNIISFMRKIK